MFCGVVEGPAASLLSGDPDEVNGHIVIGVAGVVGQQQWRQRERERGRGKVSKAIRRVGAKSDAREGEGATWQQPWQGTSPSQRPSMPSEVPPAER